MDSLDIVITSKGMDLTDSMKADASIELEKIHKFKSLLHRIELTYHFEHKRFFTHLHAYGPNLNLEAKSDENKVLHASLYQVVQKILRQVSKAHVFK